MKRCRIFNINSLPCLLLIINYLLLAVYYLLISGCCGYSTRSLLPGYIRKVHIKIFENQTYKPGLNEIATETTIEAFRNNSSLKIVSEEQADIVVNGKVTGFSKDPHVYTGALDVTQYKITVKLSVTCLDQVKNTIFWQGDISDWAIYTTDEDESIKEAIKRAAERLVTTILTNW
ncbi:MAG: LPS assembly lipoprotein LptE [bacterium]